MTVAQAQPRRDKGLSKVKRGAKGRLAQAFPKPPVKKLLCTGVLAVTLGAGFNGRAYAETRDVRPPAAAMVKPDKHHKPKYEFSQERLDKIETRMRQTELGRQLLKFADDQNISLSISNSKVMNPNPRDAIFIKGRNYSTYILLNGETKSDDEIMITIAHELRHSWHERVVKSGEMDLDPRRHWLMRRIQEADAFAFEAHFAYEYEKATGKQLDLGDRWGACDGKNPYLCVVEQYRKERDANKPVAQAYSDLLENTLRHVHQMRYDQTFVGELDDGWGKVVQNPALGANYADRFDHPVTDAAFVAKMRMVATAGLVPGADPAALTKWQDVDFLSFDKTGGREKGDQKKLAATELKFTQAKNVWDRFDAARKSPPKPPGA
jgi:hypothetical protein